MVVLRRSEKKSFCYWIFYDNYNKKTEREFKCLSSSGLLCYMELSAAFW